MGSTLRYIFCCKKKKNQEKKIPVERRDTKFVAESFQHVKIEIKNNDNSNSKEIPLINNFFKETLNNLKVNNTNMNNSKHSNSKSKNSEINKEKKDKDDITEKINVNN